MFELMGHFWSGEREAWVAVAMGRGSIEGWAEVVLVGMWVGEGGRLVEFFKSVSVSLSPGAQLFIYSIISILKLMKLLNEVLFCVIIFCFFVVILTFLMEKIFQFLKFLGRYMTLLFQPI